MNRLIILVTIVTFTNFVNAQTSLLQDKSGETSIVMSDKKALSFNAGDANVLINMSFSKPKWFIGGSTKFKSTDGISSLLAGYKFNPDVNLSLFGGKYLGKNDLGSYGFLYGSVKLTNTKYNLLKSDNSILFDSKTFTGYTFSIGYNKLTSLNILKPKDGISSSFLWGGSIDFGKINNLEDLKSVQTYTTSSNTSGTTVTTLQKDEKQGYEGEYYATTSLRLNMDGYLFPQTLGGRIGVGGYLRSQISGKSPRNNLGVGIILGQQGAPSNIVLGLLYQFNDVFNQLGNENVFFKRGGINLVAGYNF